MQNNATRFCYGVPLMVQSLEMVAVPDLTPQWKQPSKKTAARGFKTNKGNKACMMYGWCMHYAHMMVMTLQALDQQSG